MPWIDYLRYLVALLFVLALAGGLALLLRRLRLPGFAPSAGAAPRLSVVEALPVGPRHRVVLIRRDEQEHLLVLGSDSACLIETGIQPPSATPLARPEAGARERLPALDPVP